VSDDSKTIAVLEGDDIVIRMPIQRLTRILGHAMHHRKHNLDVEVLDRDEFVEDVIAGINAGTDVGLTTAEAFFVETAVFALEDGSTAMREYGGPATAP
jgi:hypothetical protein